MGIVCIVDKDDLQQCRDEHETLQIELQDINQNLSI